MSEEKKINKIIQGKAVTKKKSGMAKIISALVAEDVSNIKDYILQDVLVPAAKKAMSDIITNGTDMILYGETKASKVKSSSSRVSYGKYYDSDKRNHAATRRIDGYTFDDVILDNRGEAEEILCAIEEIISKYGNASVADLYDLVGITGRFTDNNYGWDDISQAAVIRTRDGYMIKMPRAISLK